MEISSLPQRRRLKLNVGGKVFETTLETLQSVGPDSLLSALSTRRSSEQIFIDRDPELFSVLLSLLRCGRLSSSRRFSNQELSDEARFYGIDSSLRRAASPPPLSGINATMSSIISFAADGIPSTFCALDDGSVWVAHGGQITACDWSLSHASTVRTHFNEISSLRRVHMEIAAVGSSSGAGLHFYDLARSRHIGSVHWSDPTDPRIHKARVGSIADSPDQIFAAYDCAHRENAILSVDKVTLQVISEITRQSGNSSKFVAPSKMTWMPETGTVVGSSVTSGAFGYSGYIRIWDPRSGCTVWETNEPGTGRSSRFGDSFADVGVDPLNSLLFKLCSKSGDLAMADMRMLGDDPWVYMKDKNPGMNVKVDEASMLIHCCDNQVFVGRDGCLEVWSKVAGREGRIGEELYRRNFVDGDEDWRRGMIKEIGSGGNRLFVSRENVEGIEVWETPRVSLRLPFPSE